MRLTRFGPAMMVAALALMGCNEQGYVNPNGGPDYGRRLPPQADYAGDALQRYDAIIRADAAARACRVRLDPQQADRFGAVLARAESDAAAELARSPAAQQSLGGRRAANERDAASLARQRGCRSGPVEELIGAYRNFAATG